MVTAQPGAAPGPRKLPKQERHPGREVNLITDDERDYDAEEQPGAAPEPDAATTGHYLNRTEDECIAAGQTSICLGCQALGHPAWDGRASWGARDAMTEWREELGYDPITGREL